VERLLQFERLITDATGTTYNIYVYGRNRPSDTWQGWIVFERTTDGQRFPTDVETTQPNAEAIVYWATGLTETYFEGALQRAQNPIERDAILVTPEPIVDGRVDSETRRHRLADLERAVLGVFVHHRVARLPIQTLFDHLPHAHADVVRALEDLEKEGRLLTRRTEHGNDWLFLTQLGIETAGLTNVAEVDDAQATERERRAHR
jgi:hypothetical protein